MNQASQWLGWLLLASSTLGCRSLDRFDTQRGEAYCGSLVGRVHISTGFDDARWDGKDDQPTLGLTLSTGELFKPNGVPAIVTTNDSAFGPCAPNMPLFKQAKVRTIEKALGDRLSAMQLGEDHDEDVVTIIDSSCSGSMVAILSLIQNGDIELRLLRPAANSSSAALDAERFGLFVLKKSKKGCGF